MHHPDHNVSPFNAIPAPAVIAALAMFGIELVFLAGEQGLIGGPAAVGWRLAALENYSFSGPLFDWMLEDRARFSWEIVTRVFTYPFVHGSFTQMLFAAVITLALGKFVGEVFRAPALVVVWLVSCIAGALGYALLTNTQQALFGGTAPAYGLIGALSFILWQRGKVRGEPLWMAFRLIGILIALQLAFSVLGGGIGPQIVAELVAFAAGFLISFVVSPGGWTSVARAIRQR